MSEDKIEDNAVIIIDFDENDRVLSLYKDLIKFDYIYALLGFSKIIVSKEPQVYQIKFKNETQNGFTSNIFRIIQCYIELDQFIGLNEDNVYNVIKFMLEFCVECDFLKKIDRKLLIDTINKTEDTIFLSQLFSDGILPFLSSDPIIDPLVNKLIASFDNIENEEIDVCRILNLFHKEDKIEDFYKLCDNIFIDQILENCYMNLNLMINFHEDTVDNFKCLMLNKNTKYLSYDIFNWNIVALKKLGSSTFVHMITLSITQKEKVSSIQVIKMNKQRKVKEYNYVISPCDKKELVIDSVYNLYEKHTHLFIKVNFI